MSNEVRLVDKYRNSRPQVHESESWTWGASGVPLARPEDFPLRPAVRRGTAAGREMLHSHACSFRAAHAHRDTAAALAKA
jgi:hypothetical protein